MSAIQDLALTAYVATFRRQQDQIPRKLMYQASLEQLQAMLAALGLEGLAVQLPEAAVGLEQRDCRASRMFSGVAPVTQRDRAKRPSFARAECSAA